MSHKKMAKALAMLVLANDELLEQVIDLQDELHDAEEQRDTAEARVHQVTAEGLESIELLQAMLDTVKADHQRDVAKLVEVDSALSDVGLDTFATRREAIEVSAATAEQLQERVETLLAEGDRTKANLAAMQRDRDALAAEVRDVDEALRDTGLEHHIPTGQGLNKNTRRLAIECSAAAVEEQIQMTEALLSERDALAAEVRTLRVAVAEKVRAAGGEK